MTTASIDLRCARFAPRVVTAAHYRIAVREAGAGAPIVLLHGIGSGSGSWLYQFEEFEQSKQSKQSDHAAGAARLIAWDAPGYGESAVLPEDAPDATAYAQALHALVDRLALERFVLVGQSLGAIVATAFAARYPERLRALILLAPAGGYGRASAPERESKLRTRLDTFASLGAARHATERAGNLLKPDPAPEALALVQFTMAQLRSDGYGQAAHLLAQSDLAADAARYPAPVWVASGASDRVTPEAGCRAIAAAFPRGTYRSLGAAGHAAYIDAPGAVNDLLREVLREC